MITPLVYEVHDDNDPRHFYTVDKVSEKCDDLQRSHSINGIRGFIVNYAPMWLIKKMPRYIYISLIQSVNLRTRYRLQESVKTQYRPYAIQRGHIDNTINNALQKYIRNYRYRSKI